MYETETNLIDAKYINLLKSDLISEWKSVSAMEYKKWRKMAMFYLTILTFSCNSEFISHDSEKKSSQLQGKRWELWAINS